jgi:hypothetical protein
METAASIYAIGSGVSALAGAAPSNLIADWIASWFHKRRLAKRVRAVVLLKGVTTLCQKLTTPECVYIDCDSLYQTLNSPKSADEVAKPSNPVDEIMAYSIIKKHIINITSVFKGKIILVSKCLELLKTLPVKNENIYFFAFSREMETNIGVIFPNDKEHHDATVSKFRILQQFDTERIVLNDNMKDLYESVAKKFDSKRVML